MTTRIRVNVSGELIARAKNQAEAARFLRLEQQQLKAAGAQIAAATAQKRQAPSGGRSFWQSRGRRGQQRAEETIATARRQNAFIAFWMSSSEFGVPISLHTLQIKYNGVILPLRPPRGTEPVVTYPVAYLLTTNDSPFIVKETRRETGKALYEWGLREIDMPTGDYEYMIGTQDTTEFYEYIEKLQSFTENATYALEFVTKTDLQYPVLIRIAWGKLRKYTNVIQFQFPYQSSGFARDITWRKLPIPEQ